MATTKRGHNEGSIRQRKDGRWEVRVTAGTDFETGKSKRMILSIILDTFCSKNFDYAAADNSA